MQALVKAARNGVLPDLKSLNSELCSILRSKFALDSLYACSLEFGYTRTVQQNFDCDSRTCHMYSTIHNRIAFRQARGGHPGNGVSRASGGQRLSPQCAAVARSVRSPCARSSAASCGHSATDAESATHVGRCYVTCRSVRASGRRRANVFCGAQSQLAVGIGIAKAGRLRSRTRTRHRGMLLVCSVCNSLANYSYYMHSVQCTT